MPCSEFSVYGFANPCPVYPRPRLFAGEGEAFDMFPKCVHFVSILPGMKYPTLLSFGRECKTVIPGPKREGMNGEQTPFLTTQWSLVRMSPTFAQVPFIGAGGIFVVLLMLGLLVSVFL